MLGKIRRELFKETSGLGCCDLDLDGLPCSPMGSQQRFGRQLDYGKAMTHLLLRGKVWSKEWVTVWLPRRVELSVPFFLSLLLPGCHALSRLSTRGALAPCHFYIASASQGGNF